MAGGAMTDGAWTMVAIIAGVLPFGLVTAACIGCFYGEYVPIEDGRFLGDEIFLRVEIFLGAEIFLRVEGFLGNG
jgi:hypothetical protein